MRYFLLRLAPNQDRNQFCKSVLSVLLFHLSSWVEFTKKWPAQIKTNSIDGKAVATLENITIVDTDLLADSWFKIEILDGLNGAKIDFIDPLTIEGESGIVIVDLMTLSGFVRLD